MLIIFKYPNVNTMLDEALNTAIQLTKNEEETGNIKNYMETCQKDLRMIVQRYLTNYLEILHTIDNQFHIFRKNPNGNIKQI